MRARGTLLLVVWLAGAAVGTSVGPTFAAFSATTQNTGNTFAGAPDWAGPSVPAATIRKGSGGLPGFIRPGGTYRVFALVTDQGNPPSGVQAVTANVGNVTSGQTAVTMSSGEWSVGGVSYNYRSAELTANAVMTDGAKSFSIKGRDVLGNERTVGGFSVTVDSVVPVGMDIQTENVHGGTLGRPEVGDTVLYTFSEQMEPDSIVSGWSGSATNVTVRFINNGGGGASANDRVQIWNASNSTQLPLGQIDTQGNYVTANVTFGASGTPSTMVQSGSVIKITLGTVSDPIAIATNGNDTQLWTPASAATDLAGNNCDVAVVTELGILDPDF
ncbi:MAG TPA: hypothetical protein VM638_01665 [Actinomycetota bacterium]|nr:hypothetical protein [Actinomycetota bacterium]